jgi:hypothetical protein
VIQENITTKLKTFFTLQEHIRMTTYKKLAKKLIPKDFYMEDSMGIRSTDLTHNDILLDNDLFTSLDKLEKAVFKRLTKLALDNDHDIRVLLDSKGDIYLAIEK